MNDHSNPDRPTIVRIALLIDADNMHPEFARQMFATLGELGVVTVRRAYGNFGKPEVQKWHAVMREYAVAPVHQHDLVAGKNSTDIRLAIDAIELVMDKQVDVLAIASSDSDFSPLAIRLRERGVPVIGFAQRGKTAANLALAFDNFHLLERAGADAGAPAAGKRTRAARATRVEGAPEPAAAAARTAARKSVAAPADRSTGAASLEDLPAEIAAILAAVPELHAGGMALNGASEALRRSGILKGRNASPSRLFKKYPEYFALRPADKPETVHFVGRHRS